MKSVHHAAGPAVLGLIFGPVPEAVHGQPEGFDDLLVSLWSFPEHLGVALDQVPVDLVQVDRLLLDVAVALDDLVAQRDGILQVPEPITRLALALLVLGGQLVAEKDGGQQHGVHGLGATLPEVGKARDDVRGLGALGEARRHARVECMREHQLPAARLTLLAHIRLAEDELCSPVTCQRVGPNARQNKTKTRRKRRRCRTEMGIVVVLVVGAPEERPYYTCAFDGTER